MKHLILFLFQIYYFIRSTVPCPVKCKCVGTTVNCQYNFFTDIPDNIPTGTKILYLDGNHITSIKRQKLSYLKELTFLSFSSNRITSIDEYAFYDLVKLTDLHLNNNNLPQIKRNFFKNLGLLQYLRLSKVSANSQLCIDDDSFEDQGQLQQLLLANNKMVRVTNGTFKGLDNLQVLDLSDNNIELFSSDALTHFKDSFLTLNLPSFKPLCCCQTMAALTKAIFKISPYICTNPNATKTEGDIKSMQCINDGGACLSFDESTCEIWPEKMIIVEPSSSIAVETTSVITVEPTNPSLFSSPSAAVSTMVASISSVLSSSKLPYSSLSNTRISTPPTSSFLTRIDTSVMHLFINASTKTMKSLASEGNTSTMKLSYSNTVFISTEFKSSTIASTSLAKSIQVSVDRTSSTASPTMTSALVSSRQLQVTSTAQIIASSSSTPQCSNALCTNGCSFSALLCKCVTTGTSNDCVISSNSAATSESKGMETWLIALVVGSVAFIICFVLFFMYFKKRQRQERRFNVRENGNVEMRNSEKNMNGSDNNAFIIEENSPSGGRPVAEIY